VIGTRGTRGNDPTRGASTDTEPLKSTLEEFTDFDLINRKDVAVKIDDEYYWGGGIVSNTPVRYVLADFRVSALILQVDVFGAMGDVPQSLNQAHKWAKASSSFLRITNSAAKPSPTCWMTDTTTRTA
jgi:hypothetical protein